MGRSGDALSGWRRIGFHKLFGYAALGAGHPDRPALRTYYSSRNGAFPVVLCPLPRSKPPPAQLRNRLGLWSLCLRGIELGRVLDGRSLDESRGEPDQYGGVQRGVIHLAGLYAGEKPCSRRCFHIAAAAALGTEPVRHSAPAARRFPDPHV